MLTRMKKKEALVAATTSASLKRPRESDPNGAPQDPKARDSQGLSRSPPVEHSLTPTKKPSTPGSGQGPQKHAECSDLTTTMKLCCIGCCKKTGEKAKLSRQYTKYDAW